MGDSVNHPDHYNWLPNGLEVIDVTENLNFCMGNAVKYILRADHKGKPIEDLDKAIWYLNREIERRKFGGKGKMVFDAQEVSLEQFKREVCGDFNKI